MFNKKGSSSDNELNILPTVSFVVAAFNEEDCIHQKIANSLHLNYPDHLKEFIFVTDGSTDRTVEIIQQYPQIRLLHIEEREGKSSALNRAVNSAKNDILIFSDANTLLNADAIHKIVKHYGDSRIGGVAGEKKVKSMHGATNEMGEGEGLYWKYESILKKLDSDFYSVVGAAGELFSVRKDLYEPIPRNILLDDFITSMRIAEKGYRIIYEPQAFAVELPSFSFKDEQKRKVRIAAGGFQALVLLKSLFAFWKQPKLSFLYISHRVLRWTLSPVALILAFASNFILFLNDYSILLNILFFLQSAFYLLAIVGRIIPASFKSLAPLKFPYYFLFMNVSVIQGFFRFLRNKQPVTWEKAKRSQVLMNAE